MKTRSPFREILVSTLLLLVLVLLFACSRKPKDTVLLPEGKLPWPHQDPEITQEAYEELLNELCIINNYGQYQSGEIKESAYFHDGFDVVLPNGTKIYAIESGYVKAILGSREFYRGIIIGDTEGILPSDGWAYVHTDNFQVSVGDYVPQGTYIADIHFRGLEHLHLARIRLPSGPWEEPIEFVSLPLDHFFVYKDTVPPYVDTPFHYFRNNSDAQFPSGDPTVVSGKVDIVVGMREAGEYAHISSGDARGYGDRLCVTRVEYEISGPDGRSSHYLSFDFSKISLQLSYNGYGGFFSVYKFYPVIHPNDQTFGDKVFSYYIITNTDGTGTFNDFPFSDEAFCWDTLATDPEGVPLFPDGEYTITVTAYDFMNHATTKTETIRVDNANPVELEEPEETGEEVQLPSRRPTKTASTFPTQPQNLDFEAGETGWAAGLGGKDSSAYQSGIDVSTSPNGKSLYIKAQSAPSGSFASRAQGLSAKEFLGKRVRLSASVMAEDVIGNAGLWLRVDGPDRALAFDNMDPRPIRGTVPWTSYEIVLDVPENSVEIYFGLLLAGTGQVWVDDFRLEVVDSSVPVTDLML